MSKLIKAYRFRLSPTRSQVEALDAQLLEACRLYNAAVQERREAWRVSCTRVGFYQQDAQLKEILAARDVTMYGDVDTFYVDAAALRRLAATDSEEETE